MNAESIIRTLRENAEWCDANEYEVPICMGDNQREAADLIESLTAQLLESQRREQAAVDAIRKSLRVEEQQRPTLNRCHECAKRIVDSGRRKYKYGCESLCPEALKVIVGCGFDVYEPLIPFADEWRGPQEAGEGEAK